MNPEPSNPLLRALFEDDAWRASCRETMSLASARLRRRRCWRRVRAGVAAIAIAAGACWLAGSVRQPHASVQAIAPEGAATGESVTLAPVHLHLALNLPMAADGPLTVRAYDPLPDWGLRCEPLLASSARTE